MKHMRIVQQTLLIGLFTAMGLMLGQSALAYDEDSYRPPKQPKETSEFSPMVGHTGQEPSPEKPGEMPCIGDINGDGIVGVNDLTLLVLSWGSTQGGPADLTQDGLVDILDLVELLLHMGVCD